MDKDSYYFPHFYNARNDRKIRRVRKQLGLEGYGIFFMILEVLREQIDFKYPLDDIDLLADEFGTSEEKVAVVIKNYELFEIDDKEKFFSPKLMLYLEPYFEMKRKRSEAGKLGAVKRWGKDSNAISKLKQNDSNAIWQNSKEKKSKVNESKVNESKSSSTGKLFEFYNNNIQPLTAHIVDKINTFLDDGVTEDLMLRYFEIAVERGKGNWSYIQAMAQNNLTQGVKTIADYENLERMYQESKINSTNQKITKINNIFDEIGKEEGLW